MNNVKLANLLFPDGRGDPVSGTPVCTQYPTGTSIKPKLRIAPSPTGWLHIGSLGMCLVNRMLADGMGGKFIIRIEDTDQKREVEGATQLFVDGVNRCGIKFDNKVTDEYIQSKRIDLYHVFAKKMVELGRAYPCFCTEGELGEIRKLQEAGKEKTGYWGKFAKCKKLGLKEIEDNLKAGKPWVLRADFSGAKGRVEWKDLIKGDMSLPVETNDVIVLKSNGIPPYNLAHVVDDTLMGITHVVRGEEWLVSTAQHIQLFEALGLPVPHYLHMPVICVQEGNTKRKLSKRKDKEALLENFLAAGFPEDALVEYMLTLYNTDYELWRIANPTLPWQKFPFRMEKIGSNSPLFDWNKLEDISKNIIAKMTCKQINTAVEKYFKERLVNGNETEKQNAKLALDNIKRIFAVLAIDRETEKPRKDIVKYSDILELYPYILPSFKPHLKGVEDRLDKQILADFEKSYNPSDTKEQWFEKLKQLCVKHGYSDSVKDYKKNPDAFKGHIGDVAGMIRLAYTGQENTPDLWALLKIIRPR